MNEAALVKKIMVAVKKAYPLAYVVKLADRYRRGLPDLLIVHRGWMLFVEVKTKTGIVSAIQRAEHLKIQQARGQIIVARSVEDVLEVLES